MATRQSGQGHLRLSLLGCLVPLCRTTSEVETVRFNLLNPETAPVTGIMMR